MTSTSPAPAPAKKSGWQAALDAGRAFVTELEKLGGEGRSWVLAEIGIAEKQSGGFWFGLGVGVAGAIIGFAVAKLGGL